jgi:hypothetical protein
MMNKETFDNFDTQMQCEEFFQSFFESVQDKMEVIAWLSSQSLQVKVWNN